MSTTLLTMLRASPPCPVSTSPGSAVVDRKFMDVKIKQENFSIDCDSRLAQNLRSLEAAAKKIQQFPPTHLPPHLTNQGGTTILYSYPNNTSPYGSSNNHNNTTSLHQHPPPPHQLQYLQHLHRDEMSDGFHTPSPMSSPVSPAHSTHTTDSSSEYYSAPSRKSSLVSTATSSSYGILSSLAPEDTQHITLLTSVPDNNNIIESGPFLKHDYHHHPNHLSPPSQNHHELLPVVESEYPVHLHTIVDPETGERYLTSSTAVAVAMQNLHQMSPHNPPAILLDAFTSGNNNDSGNSSSGSNGAVMLDTSTSNLVSEASMVGNCVGGHQENCPTSPVLMMSSPMQKENMVPCSSPVGQDCEVESPPPPPPTTTKPKKEKKTRGGGRKSNKEKPEKPPKKEKEPKEKKKRSQRQVCTSVDIK